MTAEADSIPEEIFYHFVTKPQSVDALFNTLYDHPDELSKQHFMDVNSHLKGNVRPGQMVVLTPPENRRCTLFEADLIEAARLIDRQLESQSEEEAKTMAEHYSLLSNIASYSGVGYGVAMNYFRHHKTQVQYLLGEIERLHVKSYKRYGKFNTDEFFRQRKFLFSQLDNVLETMVGRVVMGLDIDRKNIKRSLGLSTKSILHKLKKNPLPVSKLPEFEKNHAKVRAYTRILRGAGYVGLALDGLNSVAKVQKACTAGREDECSRSKFSEGGRFIGSIGGGVGGGLLGYGLCNAIFAVPTGGTSFLWCGIVVSSVGGYVGGKLVSKVTQYSGEILYENIYR